MTSFQNFQTLPLMGKGLIVDSRWERENNIGLVAKFDAINVFFHMKMVFQR